MATQNETTNHTGVDDAGEDPKGDDGTRNDANEGRCARCCRFFHPCMTEHNPLPEDPSICQRFKHAFLCPPHGIVGSLITNAFVVVTLWGVCWAIFREDALPGGYIFGLVVLLVACIFAGKVTELFRLPGLLGMLIMGFLLKNVPVVNVAEHIPQVWSSSLRSIALAVILIRAGLGLDYKKLKKMSLAVLRLSLLPCAIEVVAVAVSAHLLFKFPWLWAFMLGFVHAAVSPAVVVPSMLNLQERRLGTNKGIPTMLIAAGSIENVLAISGFSLILGLTISGGKGSLVFNILRAPMEIAVGISYGIACGLLLWFVPDIKSDMLGGYRFFLLFGGCLFALFGFSAFGIPGAGALGCLVTSFIAAHGWRRKGWPGGENTVAKMVANTWLIFQPLLFGLIGAEVKVSDLTGNVIGFGTIIMVIALALRTVMTFLSVFRVNLLHKEKLFVALSWLPKATVQAAIGSTALDTAIEMKAGKDEIEMGKIILTIAVFVIVVTAPIGAILIALTAPRLLHQEALEIGDEHAVEEMKNLGPTDKTTDGDTSTEHDQLLKDGVSTGKVS